MLNVTALRAMLVDKLRQAGAYEPEDGAHDVIVRLLANGTIGQDRAPAYWWVAARNMARDQARKRQRFVSWDMNRLDVIEETPEPSFSDVTGLNLAAEELAWLLAYYEAPAGSHQGRSYDRVKACRLRKKARRR